MVSFNKKSNKSSHKTKRISIETFEDWFEEEIKSHEIGELIDDYNRPVKFYLDYEKEARFDN